MPIPTEVFFPGMNAVLSEQVVIATKHLLTLAESENNRPFIEREIGVVRTLSGEKFSDAVARQLLSVSTTDIQTDGMITGMIQHSCTKPDFDACDRLFEKYGGKVSDFAASLQFMIISTYVDVVKVTGRKTKSFEANLRRDWPVRRSDSQRALVNLVVEAYLLQSVGVTNGKSMQRALDEFFAHQQQAVAELSDDKSGLLAKGLSMMRNMGSLAAANSAGAADMVYTTAIAANAPAWGANHLEKILTGMKGEPRHLCNVFGFKLLHLQLLIKNTEVGGLAGVCVRHLHQIDEKTLSLVVSILEQLEQRGMSPEATAVSAKLLDYLEARRVGSNSKDDRRRLLNSQVALYELSSRVQRRQGLLDLAFITLDGTKARTLIDEITERSAIKNSSINDGQRRELQGRFNDFVIAEESFYRLLGEASATSAGIAVADATRDTARRRYADKFDELASANPKLLQLNQPKKLAPDDLHGTLASDEAFLNYFTLQSNHILVGIVTPAKETQIVDLGAVTNLSNTVSATRSLHAPVSSNCAFGRLVALSGGGYDWVCGGRDIPARSSVVATDRVDALRLLNRYWHTTLIKPILPAISQAKRWIVSPDKDLALLPFDTLYESSSDFDDTSNMLLQRRDITLVQSFSVYALLKQREVEYAKLQRPKALFAMGNAVYGDGWEENRGVVRGSGASSLAIRAATASDTVLLSAPINPTVEQENMSQLEWKNLPGTAREVKAVSVVFGDGSSGQVDTFTGKDASESKLQEINSAGGLKNYRYLLFSAHGYLAQNPALSALVLSQQGNPPGIDGYVTASEWPLYDIQSDLTVLSACDTGVGATLAGESLMGLPYALFVAGNKNTLLTLWPVDDNATAEFMRLFFSKLKAGRAQSAALSETKREFMQHPKWSAARFWAAFVLYGV